MNNKKIKLKDIMNEGRLSYIGSCVDVGSQNNKDICRIFPNATAMAQKIGDTPEGDLGDTKELPEAEFYKWIDKTAVPAKALKGKVSYYYVAVDNSGRQMKPDQSGLFFIYNWDSDIHFFFRK